MRKRPHNSVSPRAARRRLGVAGSLALALLCGCGFFADEDNIDPPTALVDFTPSATLVNAWERKIGAAIGDRYLKLGPAAAGGRVFAADRKGALKAFEADSGKPVWETDIDVPLSGGPGAGDGLVLVGTSDGEVVAVNAESGEPAWRTRVSSEVLAEPVAGDGVVVARTIDGKLHGLDVESGEQLWIYDRNVPVLTLRGTSAPVLARGAAVTGFDSGRVAAVALSDGQPVWEAQVSVARGRTELERLVDIDADPLVFDTTVYTVAYQGQVAALDLASGELLWQRDISSHAGVAVDEDRVYVVDDRSHLWALDRFDNAQAWKQEALEARGLTAPVVFDRYVAVADIEGYVHLLRREDGEMAARVRIDNDPVLATPMVDADTLFVYSSGGRLAALRLE